MLLFIQIVSFIIIVHSQNINENINITPLTTVGFHYEFQSKLGFVVNTWNFILNLNYNILKDRLLELKKLSITLQQNITKCPKNYEREIDYIIHKKIFNLLETHDSIEYLLAHKRLKRKNRQKRGLFGGAFNFVGSIDKYLFGVMDDTDATLLYEVANHTNVADYRIRLLTNETLNIVENLQSIKHEIENTFNDCNVEKQIMYIKDNLEEIQNNYNKIITSIQTSLFSTKLSSLIINPKILLDEMVKIDSNEWDKETEWVIKPRYEDMHTVMELVQCNVFINPSNQLMFVIQVPRMDKSIFNLYKPVSLPDCKNKICKFLVPQSQYIGFESRGESKHYVRLDDTSTCTKLNNLTLCYGSMTSKKIDYSPNCDVRLFKKLNHNNCDVHATKFQSEIFYSLNNVNRWLYMVENSVHAQLNCGSGRYDQIVKLNGTGILTILKYCKLRTSRSKIMSKHIQNYDKTQSLTINFDFSRFIIPPNYNPTKIIKNLDFGTLNVVTHDLKKLLTKEEFDSIIKIPTNNNLNANWYNNFFGNWWWELKFIFYTVCIVLLFLIVLKLKIMCCNNNQ